MARLHAGGVHSKMRLGIEQVATILVPGFHTGACRVPVGVALASTALALSGPSCVMPRSERALRGPLVVSLLDSVPDQAPAGPWRIVYAGVDSAHRGLPGLGGGSSSRESTRSIRLSPPVRAGESVLIAPWVHREDSVASTPPLSITISGNLGTVASATTSGAYPDGPVLLRHVGADGDRIRIGLADHPDAMAPLEALVVLALAPQCSDEDLHHARALLMATRPSIGFYRGTRQDIAELPLDLITSRRFPFTIANQMAYGCTKDCLALAPGDTTEFDLPSTVMPSRLVVWTHSPRSDLVDQPELQVSGWVKGQWLPALTWRAERVVNLEWDRISIDLHPDTRRVRFHVEGGASPVVLGEPLVLGTAGQAAPPNLLVIDLDTLRRDRLGCYGYRERPTSDRLDSLLDAWGFRCFRRSYAASPWTVPSTAKFLTSRYLDIDEETEVPRRYTTLAEILRREGYYCMGQTGGVYLRLRGFEQGFHDYHWSSVVGKVEHVFPSSEEWLGRDAIEPFFLFVHTYETHEPLIRATFCGDLPHGRLGDLGQGEPLVPQEWRPWKCETLTREESLYVEAAYDGAVRTACDATAHLLETVQECGLRDRTVVVILSDHGEEFWDHFPGFSMHGQSLYHEILDVPFLVYDPQAGGSGLRMIDQEASLVDLVPTVMSLCGLTLRYPVDGMSLAGAMEGAVFPREIPIIAIQRDPRHALRIRGCLITQGSKLVEPLTNPPLPSARRFPCFDYRLFRELYDLDNDSRELWNLATHQSARAESLSACMRSAINAAIPPLEGNSSGMPALSDALRRQLEAAGYLLPDY